MADCMDYNCLLGCYCIRVAMYYLLYLDPVAELSKVCFTNVKVLIPICLAYQQRSLVLQAELNMFVLVCLLESLGYMLVVLM